MRDCIKFIQLTIQPLLGHKKWHYNYRNVSSFEGIFLLIMGWKKLFWRERGGAVIQTEWDLKISLALILTFYNATHYFTTVNVLKFQTPVA